MAKRLDLPARDTKAEDRIAELESKVDLLLAVSNEIVQGVGDSMLAHIADSSPTICSYLVDED